MMERNGRNVMVAVIADMDRREGIDMHHVEPPQPPVGDTKRARRCSS